MNHAFEQQPRESAKAFAAFSLYLNLGPQRGLREVARKLDKCLTVVGHWSKKFDWPARVQAHGAHLAIIEREAVEAVARGKAAEWEKRETQLREQEWALRGELHEACMKVLSKFKDGSRGATLGDAARAAETMSFLGRLATGQSTDGENTSGDKLPAV